jgi:uncharacterized protein
MRQDVNFLTFATPDLDAARRFYVDGLGWTPLLDLPDEIIFFQVAPGLLLGLFRADKFDRDAPGAASAGAVTGVTVAHNVSGPDEVRELVATMAELGATVLKPPQPGEFGGIFHAHVRDPNGVVWEVAHNPGWRVAEDGTVTLG